jgi:hypothetical protein
VRVLEGASPRAPHRPGERLEAARFNVVWLQKMDVPPGQEPVDWLLFTTFSVMSAEDALRVADYDCCDWKIGFFFRVLKSGCRIEKLQLAHADNLRRCIALYLIVA